MSSFLSHAHNLKQFYLFQYWYISCPVPLIFSRYPDNRKAAVKECRTGTGMGAHREMAAGGTVLASRSCRDIPITASQQQRKHTLSGFFPGPRQQQTVLGAGSTLAHRTGTTQVPALLCKVCPRVSNSPGKSAHTRALCKPQHRTERQR